MSKAKGQKPKKPIKPIKPIKATERSINNKIFLSISLELSCLQSTAGQSYWRLNWTCKSTRRWSLSGCCTGCFPSPPQSSRNPTPLFPPSSLRFSTRCSALALTKSSNRYAFFLAPSIAFIPANMIFRKSLILMTGLTLELLFFALCFLCRRPFRLLDLLHPWSWNRNSFGCMNKTCSWSCFMACLTGIC